MDIEEQEGIIDEEAIAEEEFIADPEETVKDNPLVHDGGEAEDQVDVEVSQEDTLVGAIGTGSLTLGGGPFNNEEALRSESVNNDENPFGASSSPEGSFGGPNMAPLSDATETIAPAAAAQETVATSADFSAGAGAAASSEPTAVNNMTQEAAGTPVVSNPEAAAAATATPAVAEAAKPKKKKTGLIVGIIVAILLLGAAIGGIIFYNVHEAKERVLSDAMTGIWLADARQFDGTISMKPKSQKKYGFKSIKISFKSDNKAANFSGSGSLDLDIDDDNSVSLDLAGAYISSDGIFVKFDKLEETVDDFDLVSAFGESGSSSDDELTEMYADLYKDILKDVAKEVDGKWYKIDASTFGSNDKSKKTYDCVTKALDDISSAETKDKITDIYKAHPFIELEKDKDTESADGLTYYYVKANEEEYKLFGNDVSELDATKKLESCFSSSSSSSSSSKEEEKESKGESSLKLGIKGWTHELRAVKGNAKAEDGTTLDLDVKINYEDKAVSAPASDAENVADAVKKLANTVVSSIQKNLPKFAKKVCEKEYGSSPRMVEYCEEEFEKEMGGAIEEMLGGLGGGIITTSTLLDK